VVWYNKKIVVWLVSCTWWKWCVINDAKWNSFVGFVKSDEIGSSPCSGRVFAKHIVSCSAQCVENQHNSSLIQPIEYISCELDSPDVSGKTFCGEVRRAWVNMMCAIEAVRHVRGDYV
jgi:hypothetical protein